MSNKKEELYLKRVRLILVVLFIIWLLIIFVFSHQDGETSSRLSLKVAKFIFKEDNVAASMEGAIRKLAHMFEYAWGGGLVAAYFLTFSPYFWRRNISATLIITLVAILDELHQHFIPGRNGVWYDVLIDVAGCILGIFIFHNICYLTNMVDIVASTQNTKADKEIENPYKYNK